MDYSQQALQTNEFFFKISNLFSKFQPETKNIQKSSKA